MFENGEHLVKNAALAVVSAAALGLGVYGVGDGLCDMIGYHLDTLYASSVDPLTARQNEILTQASGLQALAGMILTVTGLQVIGTLGPEA